MAKSKSEQDDFIMDSELGEGDLTDAQAAIAASTATSSSVAFNLGQCNGHET